MTRRRQAIQVRQDRPFKGRQFTAEVILWAVRWYLMFPISYRDLELMLLDEAMAMIRKGQVRNISGGDIRAQAVFACGQARHRNLLPPVAGGSEQPCRRWYRGRRRFRSPAILRQSPRHQPSAECVPWSVAGQGAYWHVSAC